MKSVHQHALVDSIFNLKHVTIRVPKVERRVSNLGDEVKEDGKSIVRVVPTQRVTMFVGVKTS